MADLNPFDFSQPAQKKPPSRATSACLTTWIFIGFVVVLCLIIAMCFANSLYVNLNPIDNPAIVANQPINFQQIENRLNNGGMTFRRIPSGRHLNSMWFGPSNMNEQGLAVCEESFFLTHASFPGCFLATRCASNAHATAVAAESNDMLLVPAVVWHNFVLRGDGKSINAAQSVLNK